MRFPDAGIAKNENILVLLDETSGRKLEDERAIDLRIETPIERIECLLVANLRALDSSLDK